MHRERHPWPGKGVAKSAIRPDGSVPLGVAAIRDNTADTTSIRQQQPVAAIALPFQRCGHVELNTLSSNSSSRTISIPSSAIFCPMYSASSCSFSPADYWFHPSVYLTKAHSMPCRPGSVASFETSGGDFSYHP